MDALDLLLNRQSQPRLQAPAPDGDALEVIMQSALRAPDHAGLRPWRFIVFKNEGLGRLGDIFAAAAKDAGLSVKDQQRAPELPMRAPMIIAAIAHYKEHDKVPRVEQIASTACAVHAMQMAAFAQGFAGIWRTGSYARNVTVRNALGLNEQDEIVGFLYLGTSAIAPRERKRPPVTDFFEIWS